MKRYTAYFWYVILHKWYVLLAAWRLGIPWLGIIHDVSKFSPDEWVAYARHFHNPDGSKKAKQRDKTGYYKPTDTGDRAFDWAWFLHQKRNKHHWQWWVIPEDEEGAKALLMDKRYLLEMVADWVGAGMAQGRPDIPAWYRANGHKMQLHSQTRSQIEMLLL